MSSGRIDTTVLFHTWVFLIFFLIVYPVHLLLRRTRLMTAWLLIASYVFYGWWNPWYLILIVFVTMLSWFVVLAMERSARRNLWVAVGAVGALAPLGFYKYGGFVAENLNALLGWTGVGWRLPAPDVLLPVGISFFVFQAMSYVIDAYRGEVAVERNPVRFASFVALFPQLVAGPIERARNLLPQLHASPRITRRDVTDGMSHFLVGLFKKVALADYLGTYVDQVYSAPGVHGAPALVLATFAFAWQIYFDFSGYTDMARGIARMQGEEEFRFNHPALVPQFTPRIPCYRESGSARIGLVIERNVGFKGWTSHLQLAYFDQTSIPEWTIDHPYASPLGALGGDLPAPRAGLRHRPVSWVKRGIKAKSFEWVDPASSVQWRFFRRAVETLRARGNRVFVMVGPFNEHLIAPEARPGYRRIIDAIEGWLLAEGIPGGAPEALPSRLYGDASHPLAAGYEILARWLAANLDAAACAGESRPETRSGGL